MKCTRAAGDSVRFTATSGPRTKRGATTFGAQERRKASMRARNRDRGSISAARKRVEYHFSRGSLSICLCLPRPRTIRFDPSVPIQSQEPWGFT